MGSIQTRPFVLNALEVSKAYETSRWNLSRKETKTLFWIVAVLIILALSPLLLAVLLLPDERTNVVNGLLTFSKWFFIPFLIYYIVLRLLLRLRIWIAHKINPQLARMAIVATFSDPGVDFVSDKSHSHVDWSYYRSVKESRDFFLLFAGKNVFNTIPQKALEQTQACELRALLKEKIGEYKELY